MTPSERVALGLFWLAVAALIWLGLELLSWWFDGWARRRVEREMEDDDAPLDVSSCAALPYFVGGQLLPGAAECFRMHLADCAACQAGLADDIQLSALEYRYFNGGRNARN